MRTGHSEAVGSTAESAEMWSRKSSGEKPAIRNLAGHRNDKGERGERHLSLKKNHP